MSLPESQDNSEDDALYNFIFEWKAWDDEEKREIVQIPFRCRHTPTKTDTKRSHANDAVNLVKCYTVGNAERIDMDALENIQGIPELTTNKEENPQTTAGANIADYFNYGFDEESWSVDFSKQLTLSAANRKLAAKNMVQRGHTRHEEKASCSATSGSSSVPASRESSASTDVTTGRSGSSGTVEGWQNLCAGRNNTQVATEMSPEEERITSYLPGPSRGNCLYAYTLPPSYNPILFYRRREPPPSRVSTLDSGHLQGLDRPSTSLHPYSSGVSPSTSRSVPFSGRVIATANAWERYRQQEKCDNDRDGLREHGHNKLRGRDRAKDRDSCSSSHDSGEEQTRHRDTAERGHKRHHSSRRPTGKRRRKTERERAAGQQQGMAKSIIQQQEYREGDEDRGRQRRRKRKRGSKNRKEIETNESTDGEEQTRHRDTAERGRKRHHSSRRPTGKRRRKAERERAAGQQQGMAKSIIQQQEYREGDEDRGRQRRRKRKRGSKNRKEIETNESTE